MDTRVVKGSPGVSKGPERYDKEDVRRHGRGVDFDTLRKDFG